MSVDVASLFRTSGTPRRGGASTVIVVLTSRDPTPWARAITTSEDCRPGFVNPSRVVCIDYGASVSLSRSRRQALGTPHAAVPDDLAQDRDA